MSVSTNAVDGDMGKQGSCKAISSAHRLVPLLKEEEPNAVARLVAHASIRRGSIVFHLDVSYHYEYPPVLSHGHMIDIFVNVADGAQAIARSVLHKVYANLDISSHYSLGNDASRELRTVCFNFMEFVESLDFKALLADVKTGSDVVVNHAPTGVAESADGSSTTPPNRVKSEASEDKYSMSMLAVRYMHILLRVRFVGNSVMEQSRSSDFERLYDGTRCRLMDLQMVSRAE
jgi:hypothetical protein